MKQFLFCCTQSIILLVLPLSLLGQVVIRGQLADAKGEPIATATVLLLNAADSILVKGTFSDNNGGYQFENITPGKYFLSISHVSFVPVNLDTFLLTRESASIDNGTKVLEPLPSTLSAVTVVSKRPLYEQKPDRLVINVENSISAPGNTALQVLERSPGVVVSRQNNTISMLGKDGVNILINGKQTYMPASAVVQMLDGMSAGNIDKIELITTPPANFDAEGKAGYINIVLKQTDDIGTNGSFSLTAGYAQGPLTQSNLNFNHRKNKVNLFGDLAYSHIKNPWPGDSYNRISNNNVIYETYLDIDRTEKIRLHNIRLGLDYQLSPRTILGILFNSNGRRYRQSETTTASYYINHIIDTVSKNQNRELNNWQDYGVNFNIQQSLKKDQGLIFNFHYLHYKNNQPFNYFSQYYDKSGNFAYDETFRNGKKTPIDFWIAAIDYTKKISGKVKMEAGLKGTIANFTNELNFERLLQNGWVKDPGLSSIYTLKENYSAAYLSFNVDATKKSSLKAGLRYEFTNSNLGSTTEKNIIDRHYGKLFPTFFYSTRLDDYNTLNFSYNARITRPTFNVLAPFVYYSTRNSVLTGNPGLQPAIAHAVTAGYTYKKYFLQFSFTHENDAIAFFQPDIDSVANKTVARAENLESQKQVAAVLSIPITVRPWWNIQNNITATWQQINAIYKKEPVRLEQKNIAINMTHTLSFPKDFSLEITGLYLSPSLNGIMVFKSIGLLDVGVRKKISDRDALNFSASNLLNSFDFRGYTDLPEQNLVGSVHIRFSWRTYKLTYIRNFGKLKLKGTRERSTGAENEKTRAKYD